MAFAVQKIIFWTLAALVIIILVSLFVLLSAIFPKRNPLDRTPKDLGLDYENVQFTTVDGVKIKGWFIPSRTTKEKHAAIIVLHGYPFNKANILPLATFLHDEFNLLFIDFRAMGESKGRMTTAGALETRDVEATIHFLESRNISRVGLFGFSMGGSVAIMVNSSTVRAVVADSPYASLDRMVDESYRQFLFLKHPFAFTTKIFAQALLGINPKNISPANAIRQKSIPVLLIHGENDSQISVENSKTIKQANPSAELWLTQSDHGMSHADQTEVYEKKVSEFFRKSI